MDDLRAKVAVVTGAGSGIGRALAQRFAFEGMRLAVADVEPDALDETVALLLDAGAEVLARPTDVTDADAVEELAADVYERFGAAHVLCNNAGVFAGGLLWELDDATVDWVLDVNVRGILHGVRAFVPRMLAGGEPGHVVTTASSAGIFGSPYTGPYTVSKFAAVGMSEVLAWDLSISGAAIGVSVLCPGAVATRIGFSDRNRPGGGDVDGHGTGAGAGTGDEPASAAALVTGALRDTTAKGIGAEVVADHVVDAIRTNRFLVFTGDSYAEALRGRTDSLLDGALPPLIDFS